jgi:hypothetical protein
MDYCAVCATAACSDPTHPRSRPVLPRDLYIPVVRCLACEKDMCNDLEHRVAAQEWPTPGPGAHSTLCDGGLCVKPTHHAPLTTTRPASNHSTPDADSRAEFSQRNCDNTSHQDEPTAVASSESTAENDAEWADNWDGFSGETRVNGVDGVFDGALLLEVVKVYVHSRMPISAE